MTVPNTLGTSKLNQALVEACEDAASRVADNEKIVPESIRIEDTSVHHDDLSRVDVRYVVMVPGCSGWSAPLT
jgi:hypothetical protein